MAISRVKTWINAETLSHTDLNAEFDNILNNALSLISPLTAELAAGGNDLTGLDEVALNDAAANATAVGRLRRNGNVLTWHDRLGGVSIPVMVGGGIFGLTLTNGTDATNDIDIAVGAAADDSENRVLRLTSALTKQLDAAWAVGSAAGGLDIGTIANGTYHVWLIYRSDTAVTDALYSRNPGVAATITVTIASPGVVTWTDHGLQAGSSVVFTTTGALPTGITAGTRYYVISTGLTTSAFQFSASEGGTAVNTSGSQSGVHTGTSNPVYPASYDYKRRIGSILRESAAIVGFAQEGDYFERKAVATDISANNPGSSAVLRTLSVPIGILVYAHVVLAGSTTSSSVGTSLRDPATTDEAASPYNYLTITNSDDEAWSGYVRTNTSGQIRSRSTTTTADFTMYIGTHGWIDGRGRDA